MADDHALLRQLATGLQQVAEGHPVLAGRLVVHPAQTNILFTDVDAAIAPQFTAWLAQGGVRVTTGQHGERTRLRWVAHLDVNAADVAQALACVQRFAGE